MANLSVSYDFVPGTQIKSAEVDTNFAEIVAYINNRNAGTTGWDGLVVDTTTLVVDATNNRVGIGTASPGETLTLSGVQRDPSGLQLPWQVQVIDTASMAINVGGGIAFGGSYTGTTPTYFSNILGAKENATDSNVAGYLAFYTRTAAAAFSGERMRITSTGNVGIGTAAPDRKLYVATPVATGSLVGNRFVLTDGTYATLELFQSQTENQLRSNLTFGLSGENNSTSSIQVDASAAAGTTRLLVYDVDNGQLERVTVGAADSGGAGFKVLRIPN